MRRAAIATLAILAAAAQPCHAQQEGDPPPADEERPRTGLRPADIPPPPPLESKIKFSVSAGFQYVLKTDIDGGGELSIGRTGLEVGTEIPLEEDFKLIANLRYDFNVYDFSAMTALGADPWGDTNYLGIDARIQWNATERVIVFAGGVVQSWRETTAGWDGSWTGGGIVGASWIHSKTLVFGLGFGVVTQLEDPVLAYPIIILSWKIKEKMRLTSVAGPAGIAATGLEFVYSIGKGWETGVGARYEFRRFRLDDSGVAPGGVGEETNLPVWVRISYRVSKNFSFDIYGGILAGGSLAIDNAAGVTVGDVSYSMTPMLAVSFRLRF